MDNRQHIRASDADRQEVVDRLAAALAEGRLKMDEYAERMGLAYEAVTYGDLAALSADLPEAGPVAKREAAPPAATPQAAAAPRGVIADLPAVLKVLWTIWLAAVAINLIVWVLVSGTAGDLIYPWPVWVAGPSGAALLAVSAGVTAIRRGRRSAAQHPPGGQG
jgi:DUF1707 SHOCT-like domain